MKYLNQKFSVAAPDSDAYRENWDRIFGSKPDAFEVIEREDTGQLLEVIEERPRCPNEEHCGCWPDDRCCECSAIPRCKVHCTCTKYLGKPCCVCGAEPPDGEP